jgi:hypothetical protein
VVTFNPIATMRFELLERTVRSIEKAFPLSELFLLDNCSTDGSWDAVCELLGEATLAKCLECARPQRGRWHASRVSGDPEINHTPGAGRQRLWSAMFAHVYHEQAPFWVWSDDDMLWRPGAEQTLRDFWRAAPEDIWCVSGLLEPVWHWNTPRETVEAGGVKVLVRDSAPGAAWTFRNPRAIHLISRDPELLTFGYDHKCCVLHRKEGTRVAQIDLAEHIGWGRSTHGNDAPEHPSTRPLDRKKWGV